MEKIDITYNVLLRRRHYFAQAILNYKIFYQNNNLNTCFLAKHIDINKSLLKIRLLYSEMQQDCYPGQEKIEWPSC